MTRAPRGVGSTLIAMAAVAVVLGVVVGGLMLPFAMLAGVSVKAGEEHLVARLPLPPLPERSRVLDRDGRPVATFYRENRVVVGLDRVDPLLVEAVLAIEDDRFFDHGALDLQGTLRALVNNAAAQGVVQGGSSITQQLVKMSLVEQATTAAERRAATEPTLERKVNELRYAIWLEQTHDKHWILERYLNTVYLGDGTYGVEAAAEHYFSRSAADLTLGQAALLAGMIKNPMQFDPIDRPTAALERRDVVLDRMAELGSVGTQRAARVQARGLGLDVTPVPNGCVRSSAPFFCDYVRMRLLLGSALADSVRERRRQLLTGGLTVRTTLDLRFQRAAEAAARNHVDPTDRAVGALAMLEPGTGDVRALAQSRPMGRGEGQTYLNYLVPRRYGAANGFHAGSTFKVFVLSAAIEQGIPLDTEIRAPQEVSIPVRAYRGCRGYSRSTEVWSPQNSTGAGVFDLYSGTQQSVNTFYAQLELRTGLCQPYRLAQRMGIPLTDPDSQRVPSFTLGVVDVDPLTMAEAYATFAARGRHCTPRAVTAVVDAAGDPVARFDTACERVLPAAVADAVNDVLRGVQQPGGFGHGAGLALDQESAGKTGTSQQNRSVWFIGYTPNLVGASMVGGTDRDGRWQSLSGQTIGGRFVEVAYGSTLAGPIWGDAMHPIQRWLPDDRFVPPDPREIEGVRRPAADPGPNP